MRRQPVSRSTQHDGSISQPSAPLSDRFDPPPGHRVVLYHLCQATDAGAGRTPEEPQATTPAETQAGQTTTQEPTRETDGC